MLMKKTNILLNLSFVSTLIFLLSFCFTQKTLAQMIDTSQYGSDPSIGAQIPQIEEQVKITIDPIIPKPGDQVTITIEDYGIDLDRATVTWALNGKNIKAGVGVKSFILNAGPVGTVSNIVITVAPINGPSYSRTVKIAPADVDLIWEANSYVPPFYKGKALDTFGDDVKIVAIPTLVSNNKKMDPSQAVYTWKLNYEVQGDQSGTGVNYYDLPGKILPTPDNISVTVAAGQDRSITASKYEDVTAGTPGLDFYENNPIYGILFNRALSGTYNLNQDEVKIAAYPYFFGTKMKNDTDLTYTWNLNNTSINVPANQNEVTFRNANKQKGLATIQLRVNSASKLLQEVLGGISFSL